MLSVFVLKLSAQVTKKGGMPQFYIIFYANFTILAVKRGGMAPPLNTPLSTLRLCLKSMVLSIKFVDDMISTSRINYSVSPNLHPILMCYVTMTVIRLSQNRRPFYVFFFMCFVTCVSFCCMQ